MNDTTLPAVTEHDVEPAWLLQVELRTRITTQPLHYRSGDEESALESVHQLFDSTRKLLEKNPKAKAFEKAALFLLNSILRSNTARWHRWLVDKKFRDEQKRRQFRYELKQVQPLLIRFADFLGLLTQGAGKSGEAAQMFKEIVEATPDPKGANLGATVLARIGKEIEFKDGAMGSKLGNFVTADQINAAEREFIHRRRKALEVEKADVGNEEPVMDATGLCLSGGGIRSATFCLGIVQVLDRQGMLTQLDYLSTVSGGGYLGTFLSAFLGTPAPKVNGPQSQANAKSAAAAPVATGDVSFDGARIRAAIDTAFDPKNGSESGAIRHLRNNSRYLASGGTWALIKIVGLLISGILTNILLVLPVPLAGVLSIFLVRALRLWGENGSKTDWLSVSLPIAGTPVFYIFAAAAVLLSVLWFLLPVVRNRAHGAPPNSERKKLRTFWETLSLVVAVAIVAAAALLLLPQTFYFIGFLRSRIGTVRPLLKALLNAETLSAIGAIAPVLLGVIAGRLNVGLGKKVATILFLLSGPALYLLTFFFVASRLFEGRWCWECVAFITFALAFWGWLFVDINEFSPHRYYRNRLCECYLAARGRDQTGLVVGLLKRIIHGRDPGETLEQTDIGKLRQLPLSKMNATGAAPYHLINASVNLPASHEPNLRGRDCDFYLFSKYYCGGPICGYFPTRVLETLDPHVDLGTAMAISGAAASANMGVNTMIQYRFLLALLNVRLGYWLRNPLHGLRRLWNIPGPQYLLAEMTGWMHEKAGYLNISDGGHIENLAFYEMLRRRCKFIIVVDGGMEPGMECADLMLAQRYAQIDLSIRFELDITDLALNAEHRTRAYAVFGKIHYNQVPGAGTEDLGWVIYLKLACTGEEPGYVTDYRRVHPDFPHQSTAQQLYDEAEFEAYRRLGECAATSLFRGELAGKPINPATESTFEEPVFSSLRDWFQALADNLLPDNDEAFLNPQKKDGPDNKPETLK